MMSINLMTTLFAPSRTFKNGSASFPTAWIDNPTSIENTMIATILLLVSIPLKSLTVKVSTVLLAYSKNPVSVGSYTAYSSLITSLIASVFSGSTNLVEYVVASPTATAIKLVTINEINIVTKTLPNLLGCLIFAIEVVMVRKIKGTIITNNKLIKISPNGAKYLASSPKTIPTIAPIIKPMTKIIVFL